MTDFSPTVGPLSNSQISHEQAALALRVTRLESIVLRFVAALGAVCLILGELLPFMTYTENGKQTTASLASFGFTGVAYRGTDGSADGLSMVIGVAFIGLLVVVLASLAALLTIGLREGTSKSTRWVGVVVTLLVIGVVGVWLTAAVGGSNGELHQGPFWLTAGAIVLAILARSQTVQPLWVRPE